MLILALGAALAVTAARRVLERRRGLHPAEEAAIRAARHHLEETR